MTISAAPGAWMAMALVAFMAWAPPAVAEDWSEPAEVLYDVEPVVTYRARLQGEFLVVEARHKEGWHTYAMDNKLRARERLAGKRSLGIDGPTEISLIDGLELDGPWRQTPPNDYSKPDLRWFTWGFDGAADFAAKVRRTSEGPARIAIRGQACDEKNCLNIDLELSIPKRTASGGSDARDLDLGGLVAVQVDPKRPSPRGHP